MVLCTLSGTVDDVKELSRERKNEVVRGTLSGLAGKELDEPSADPAMRKNDRGKPMIYDRRNKRKPSNQVSTEAEEGWKGEGWSQGEEEEAEERKGEGDGRVIYA